MDTQTNPAPPAAEDIVSAGVLRAVTKASAAPKRLRNETYLLEMVSVLTDAVMSLREDLADLKSAAV